MVNELPPFLFCRFILVWLSRIGRTILIGKRAGVIGKMGFSVRLFVYHSSDNMGNFPAL